MAKTKGSLQARHATPRDPFSVLLETTRQQETEQLLWLSCVYRCLSVSLTRTPPPPSPLYTGLGPTHKIPAGGYGEDQNLRYLVMSRLGPDVEAAQEKGNGWSLAQKVGYARQMLALLRALHDKCKMVFVDVKPGTVQCSAVQYGTAVQ